MNKRLPLAALVAANAVSLLGNVMAMIALPWFVLQTGGGPGRVGLVAFCSALPSIAAMLVGGTLADRIGHKLIGQIADAFSLVAVAAIPLLQATIGLPFWLLLLLVLLGALFDAAGQTGRSALVPELAQRAGVGMERAAALMDGARQAAVLVGAPLVGVLLAATDMATVLWIDAATFGASLLAVGLAVPTLARASDPAPVAQGVSGSPAPGTRSWTSEMREGVRFILGHRFLVVLIGAIMAVNFLDGALAGVIAPVYARDRFADPRALGWFVGAFGAAALAGTALYGSFGHRISRRALICGGLLLASLRYFVMAAQPGLPALLAAQALAGLALGPVNPSIVALGYERVPAELRARVFGVVGAGMLVASPLAMLAGGLAVGWFGSIPALWAMGAGYLATAAWVSFNQSIKALDAPDGQAIPAAQQRRKQMATETAASPPQSGWRALLTVAWRRSRSLTVVGVLLAILLVCTLVGLAVDGRVVMGAPAWLKPAKFALSFGVYSFSLIWLLRFVQGRRFLVGLAAVITALGLLVEIAIITLQAARGTLSHFNLNTPLDTALFSVMGVFVIVIWLMNLLVAVLLLIQRFPDRAFAWALRLGVLITLAGSLIGALMLRPTAAQLDAIAAKRGPTIVGAHGVGVADGGPGLPVLGWSLEGGDLRVPHFFGLHALQVLPLVGWALGRRGAAGRPESARLRLVWIAGLAYAGFIGLLTWQALRGQPVIAPDATTALAFAGLLAAAGLAAWLVVARSRRRLAPEAAPASGALPN